MTQRRPRIFMMDLLATVPYYTAYLSRALLDEGANLQVGSIHYYLDPACFSTRGLTLDPGLLNLVGRFPLPPILRRPLKLAEAILNLAALTIRFLFAPPQIVHVQFLPMLRWPVPLDLWFVLFCRRRGARIVLTVHDLLPHDTADTHRQIFQYLYHQVDALICHSDHIKTRLAVEFLVPPEDITVIPHGPFFYDLPETDPEPTRHSLNIPPAHTIALWQGIIFPYKGLDLLLSAWQIVEAAIPIASLVVVGTGRPDLLEKIRAQVHQLGLERVILDLRFTSAEELVAIYRAADLVVYPYRAITTSGALATGLALGKTIVASDLPVFRELLTDGKNARLIDPRNPATFAATLIALLQDQASRQHLAAAVRQMNFGAQSWRAIAASTMQLYVVTLLHPRMV